MTQKLSANEIGRLYDATRATLIEWTERLRAAAAKGVSGKGDRVSGRDGVLTRENTCSKHKAESESGFA